MLNTNGLNIITIRKDLVYKYRQLATNAVAYGRYEDAAMFTAMADKLLTEYEICIERDEKETA